jgi:hypothetical protein
MTSPCIGGQIITRACWLASQGLSAILHRDGLSSHAVNLPPTSHLTGALRRPETARDDRLRQGRVERSLGAAEAGRSGAVNHPCRSAISVESVNV